MILHTLTSKQERVLRVEYVNNELYNADSYNGYRQYILDNIDGAVEVGYRGGDDYEYVEAIVFDDEKNLAWFILRYS